MAIALRVEKKPNQSFGYLSLLGFLFALCALAMIVKTAIDAYREMEHAKWPSAVGIISQQTVRKSSGGSLGDWYIESVVRYNVDGEDLTANTRSNRGAFWEELSMRRWARQHRPGTSLPIRYDPQHHNRIVPQAGVMPESEPQAPDDLKGTFFFFILAIACIIIGRVTQRRTVKPV